MISKDKFQKILLSILTVFTILILSQGTVLGVEIVDGSPENEGGDNGGEQIMGVSVSGLIGMVFLGLLIGLFFGGFVWGLIKIFKRIKESQRRRGDIIYNKFKDELEICSLNSDKQFKWRNPKLLFIYFKRMPVYLNTSLGEKFIALYDGEVIKKESFYLISLYQKVGLFSYRRMIIVLPYHIKDIVKKNHYGKRGYLSIEAESLDETQGSDYYLIPTIKNPNNSDPSKAIIDFSDFITNNFIKNYIYREVIKDNMISYKENMDKAVDMNPNISYSKKDNSQQR